MPSVWYDMWQLQQGQPVPGGVQIDAEAVTSQRVPKSGRSVHEVQWHEEPCPLECKQNDRSFDSVNIKYLSYIMLTKLESRTSQKGVHITYKIDTRSDGNLMPFKFA